jgi:hypothetical protein
VRAARSSRLFQIEDTMTEEIKVPKVRLVKPGGRLIQLRYTDPETKKEIRISTGTANDWGSTPSPASESQPGRQ